MPLRNWSQAICPISATGGAFSQNITRAYSKLKAAFITFRPTLARVKGRGLWAECNQLTCHHGGGAMGLYTAPECNFNRDTYRR